MSAIATSTIGRADAVLLDDISEDSFLANLKLRHSKDKIYSYIGEVLISVNPYADLGIYGEDVINSYHGTAIHQREPHIYALAEAAYSGMRRKMADCCIVISGESGAGKTEASKSIMRYIAAVSTSGKGSEQSKIEINRVKDTLLASNPVLEAFGNAKTARNNNSSRFGKYMDINFDFKFEPVGGHIHKYLLEKARVVAQPPGGDRNFHLFYQILAGASPELLAALKLGSGATAASYPYLVADGNTSLEEDAADFAEMKEAMGKIGFSGELQTTLFKLVAAVVHLGSIKFAAAGGGEHCTVENKDVVANVAELLGVSLEDLETALTFRVVAARGEVIKSKLNVDAASHARDALAKALYDSVFTHVVAQINGSIEVKPGSKGTVLGVLDIYGFEIFPQNGFEQFCINYCNEKLQQLFIELVMKREQEEYAREGIPWIDVEYFDNAAICALVETPKTGIIAILDEQCARPNGTDPAFLAHMDTSLKASDRYTSHQQDPSSGCNRDAQFKVKHFAGDVVYTVGSFVERNSDSLYQDLKRMLYNSSTSELKTMFPSGADDLSTVHKNPATAATNFKASMHTLVAHLQSKEPYYVRCIKPNAEKAPATFDDELALHQVRYLGLVENLRVRRAGYCSRQPYEDFVMRYKMLSPQTWPNYRKDQKDGAKIIIAALGLEPEVAFGTTKLFVKEPNSLYFLEEKREEAIPLLVAKIQAFWRGVLARRYVKRLRAAIKIKRAWRGAGARKLMVKLEAACAGVGESSDFGKSIVWPAALGKLGSLVMLLQLVHRRWRAKKVLAMYDDAATKDMLQKVKAYDLIGGKGREHWGVEVKWEGNYMSKTPQAAKFGEGVLKLFLKYGGQTVKFSSKVHLLNAKGKNEERCLLVTETHIFILDPKSFKMKTKTPTLLTQVTGFGLSKGEDQACVIRVADGHDLVIGLSGEGMSAELISTISQTVGTDIPVEVGDHVKMTLKGKEQDLAFAQSDSAKATGFKSSKKDGVQLVTRRASVITQQMRRGARQEPPA